MHAAGIPTLALFGSFGWQEIAIILVIGVLLFGRRLPEVGRNVGRSIVEFKKGLRGVQDQIDQESNPYAHTPKPIEGDGRRVSRGAEVDPAARPEVGMDRAEADRVASEPARD